jgi:hypothetical protein
MERWRYHNYAIGSVQAKRSISNVNKNYNTVPSILKFNVGRVLKSLCAHAHVALLSTRPGSRTRVAHHTLMHSLWV